VIINDEHEVGCSCSLLRLYIDIDIWITNLHPTFGRDTSRMLAGHVTDPVEWCEELITRE